jgi:hypothetical protein
VDSPYFFLTFALFSVISSLLSQSISNGHCHRVKIEESSEEFSLPFVPKNALGRDSASVTPQKSDVDAEIEDLR